MILLTESKLPASVGIWKTLFKFAFTRAPSSFTLENFVDPTPAEEIWFLSAKQIDDFDLLNHARIDASFVMWKVAPESRYHKLTFPVPAQQDTSPIIIQLVLKLYLPSVGHVCHTGVFYSPDGSVLPFRSSGRSSFCCCKIHLTQVPFLILSTVWHTSALFVQKLPFDKLDRQIFVWPTFQYRN